MSDRTAVLSRVRRAASQTVAHPGPYTPPPGQAGWQPFAGAVAEAGGVAHGPFAGADLPERVRALLEGWQATTTTGRAVGDAGRAVGEARRVVAEAEAAERLGPGPWETARDVARPQSFADVAIAIASASVGVAENGAVAVERARAPHRALHFLCERLVLLLDAEALVPDMHAAQAWLTQHGASPHHMVWISGPSKTADIEQALVYGAHGPVALAVLGWRG